jgi:hypothetical protein
LPEVPACEEASLLLAMLLDWATELLLGGTLELLLTVSLLAVDDG